MLAGTYSVYVGDAVTVAPWPGYTADQVTLYWKEVPDTALGDLDCDGDIDLSDVPAFVLALTDPAAYAVAHAACCVTQADLNQDGQSDGLDIQLFVNTLVAP